MTTVPQLDYTLGVLPANRPRKRVEKAFDNSLPQHPRTTYGTGKLDGRDVYSNGYFIAVGKSPTTGEAYDLGPHMAQHLPHERGAMVTPIGFGDLYGNLLVWFSDGSAVNAGIYDHLMRAFPKATWWHGSVLDGPLTVLDAEGVVAGMAMIINTCVVPVNLRGYLAPEVLKRLDKAATSYAKKELSATTTVLSLNKKSLERQRKEIPTLTGKRRISDAERTIRRYEADIAAQEAQVRNFQAVIDRLS